MSDRDTFASEMDVGSPVTLSDMGVALILLENELYNIVKAQRRWMNRSNEAQRELEDLSAQRRRIEKALERIKDQL